MIPQASGGGTIRRRPAKERDVDAPRALNYLVAFSTAIALAVAFLAIPSPVSGSHIPAWTYISKDFNARQDPVSMIAYTGLAAVTRALQNAGWHRTSCGYTEYVYYNGQWRAQGAQLERDQEGFCGYLGTRKHIRLWQLETNLVVMAGHLDHTHSNGHQVHDYEGIEDFVAGEFQSLSSWQVFPDDHFMDNYVSYLHDNSVLVFNDGNATEIYRQ